MKLEDLAADWGPRMVDARGRIKAGLRVGRPGLWKWAFCA